MQPKKDSRIDSVLRKALAGRVTKGSGDCPDENIVTMYLEGRLEPAQRARYEGHASSCRQCRQVLALAMRLAAGDENEPSAAVSAGHAHLSLRFWLPVSAVAIVVLAIAALVFQQMRGPRKDAEIAEYRTSASREAQPAVDPAARTEDLSPAVSELRQDASSSAGSKKAVPASKRLTGTGAQAEKPRDQLASQRLPSQRALSAAPPAVAAPTAESQKEALATLAGITAPRPDNAALDAAGRGITSGTGIQAKRIESPQAVLAAFSQQFLSDQAYVSPLRLQDQTPPRSASALKTAPASKKDSTQASEGVAAKIEEPEVELKLRVDAHKQLGDKVFYLVSGYWIDAECGKHPRDRVVEISEGDTGFEQMREAFPGITELRSSKTPVLIHWNGKNYLIAAGNKQ
jgi:hypothetical protein